ncbi:hypothetical protein EDC44_10176 [Cricetibacter osteomyelitidis]|uniref:Uncharacterized protein n=1 Tax=Cricetibacter osteomyelitidis TaxID=1521931 RepID=A0A4V2T2J5_9PAST|nr:competence protein [Cricetibacter osteomyelitidis]TCP97693.1 hypothetical protein EDC44_10176 [Cricetibacter osteomyelitidis]
MKMPLIPYRYAKNPHHFFAKWLQLTPLNQWLSLIFIVILLSIIPLFQLYQQYVLHERLNIERQQIEGNLQHQQKIFQTLKQKADNTALTAETASVLVPINKQIQLLLHKHNLQAEQSQWLFFTVPSLDLKLKGRFADFHQFLTALLRLFPHLNITGLHIDKTEQGFIACHLSFQLTLAEFN